MSPSRLAALAALALLAVEPGARADEPCAARLDDWQVRSGDLAPGLDCGVFLGSTDAAAGPFSYAYFVRREPVAIPYEAEVTWRRIGTDTGRTLELYVGGGILLFKDGAYALFTTNESFSAEGWHPRPGLRVDREGSVKVKQEAQRLTLLLDGEVVHTWALAAPGGSTQLGVGSKGASGYRARVVFRGFGARALSDKRP